MVQAANFGNGQTQLWSLRNKWRTDVSGYGYACEQLGRASPGSQAAQQLRAETSRRALELYNRAAAIELRLKQLEERVDELVGSSSFIDGRRV